MKKIFDLIIVTRKNFIHLIEGLTVDQLNKIPAGFNNNIAWNFGHIVVTTQGVCYRLSGLAPNIDETYITKYKKGTKPEAFISPEEIDFLKTLALQNIEQLKLDYANGVFKTFTPYTTSFNNTLNNIEEGIAMVQSHDALHYGYALALRRLISKS